MKGEEEAGQGFDLLQFAGGMALQWGKADLLAVGPDRDFNRIGELAAYFACRGDEKGNRTAGAVWLILPPAHSGDSNATATALRKAFSEALTRASNGQASQNTITEAFDFISFMSVPSFDGDALVELLGRAPARTGIIIADAGRFRLAATKKIEGAQIEEDVCSAHVHQLLVEVHALCSEGGQYVAVDFGLYCPSRQRNIDLLCSVEDTGVVAIPTSGLGADEIVGRVSHWYDAAKAGDVGRVVREIDEDAALSDLQRFFLKLEAFSISGFHDQVRRMFRENPKWLIDLPADQALNIARISEAADDDDHAEDLIRTAIPSIRTEQEFSNAFATALRTGRRDLVGAVMTPFKRFYPNSSMLRRHTIAEMARSGDYGRVVQLLRAGEPENAEGVRYYELLGTATATAGWKPAEVYSIVSSEIPGMSDEVVIEIPRVLEREGRRSEALDFLIERGKALTGDQILCLIRVAGRAIQAAEISTSDPAIEHLADLALGYLARHPGDGSVRTKLTDLMAPNMTAGAGLAILVVAVLKRAQTVPSIRERPKVNDRPRPIEPSELKRQLERISNLLHERGSGMMMVGKHTLAATELDVSAEQLISAIVNAVDFFGARLVDQADHNVMMLNIAVAMAVAPLSPEPDEDLTVVRTVGGKFAIAGKGQVARDVAEFALTSAGPRPERRRQALFTFADIYARLGMKTEALVALGASLEASSTVTWDEVWFETNLLFRLLRDTGMSELGLQLLDRSRQALDALGLSRSDGYRIETLALQAATASFASTHGDDRELITLLKAAEKNAEDVIARSDDLLPIAMVLNTLIGIAESRCLGEASSAKKLMERLIVELPAPQQTLIRAAGPSPSVADIAAVAATIDEARYAADAGYDIRHLRLMTRRLVGEAINSVDSKALIYAIETSADHAISVRNSDGARIAVERLLTREDAPLEAANALSRHGVAIVGMALFESQLATIEFENGNVSDVTLEAEEVFSADALRKWSKRFPRDYMLDDKDLGSDLMRQSVGGLGLTKLPKKSVVIADAQLQRLPPNLLTIDGSYAGFDHAIGIAPSLEWLTASRSGDRRGNGRARMWIPMSPHGSDTATLTLMRTDIQDILEREQIPLELNAQPSSDFASADVAIISAHGGLAEVNRYFRSVSNDDQVLMEVSMLAEVTRRARLTILFVCSGGRIDPHPETGMAVGLAKQILARGCSAVIAPAWPIPFFMARPWLDGFMREWRNGTLVLDAFHAGNLAVAKNSSWDPKRSLAMTLYGDPFIKAG